MGKEQEQEQEQVHDQKQQKPNNKKSLRSKAAHFVADLTTVLLNPISDKPSSNSNSKSNASPQTHSSSSHDNLNNTGHSESEPEEVTGEPVDGPDTSSFTAFLYSLLASSESHKNSNLDEKTDSREDDSKPSLEPTVIKENAKKKSLFSKGKQTLGKAFHHSAKLGGFRNQGPKASSETKIDDGSNYNSASRDEGICTQTLNETLPSENLPEISEPSLLLSEKTRSVLYAALPVIVQGRKWMLLYSTWRHGISLSTLYRRSLLLPGLSLLVVGDRNGTVFGGLVEAPLRPNNRRYQGTNNSFVFTNISGCPVIFRPTGINRYFTVCNTEYLAMGGGGHFALYLDGELLTGSSSTSETYGNPCLARSENFEVKEIELWGFVYASKYDEMIALSRTEAPGICHW